MAEENDREYTVEEIYSAMFAQLVMMFASAAMQQMGKLVSRETGKVQVDLDAAQSSIDILDMLEAKTRGNLSADEEQMLKQMLSSLKLTFVEMQAGHGGAPAPAPEPPPAPAAEPAAPAGDIQPSSDTAKGDDKQPRFHKKY